MASKPDFIEKEARLAGSGSDDVPAYGSAVDPKTEQLGFWTRMGCTAESFKRRNAIDEGNQLNQTLKTRHLHMIAIGGSIGAGLFVGSGSALSRGVSLSCSSS